MVSHFRNGWYSLSIQGRERPSVVGFVVWALLLVSAAVRSTTHRPQQRFLACVGLRPVVSVLSLGGILTLDLIKVVLISVLRGHRSEFANSSGRTHTLIGGGDACVECHLGVRTDASWRLVCDIDLARNFALIEGHLRKLTDSLR